MITTKLCLVAEDAVVDQLRNMVSAWNIIDDIIPASLPLSMQKLAFVILWEKEDGDANQAQGNFTLSINGRNLLQHPFGLDFGTGNKHRTILNVGGLVLPEPGELLFRATCAEQVAEFTLTVRTPTPTITPAA